MPDLKPITRFCIPSLREFEDRWSAPGGPAEQVDDFLFFKALTGEERELLGVPASLDEITGDTWTFDECWEVLAGLADLAYQGNGRAEALALTILQPLDLVWF